MTTGLSSISQSIDKVFPYLRPYRLPLIGAFSQVFLVSGLELLRPWPVKVIVDHVVGGTPMPWSGATGWMTETLLLMAVVSVVLIQAAAGGMSVLNNFTSVEIGQRLVRDLRRDLFAHLQRQSLLFHTRHQVGDLQYRVAADTFAIQSMIMNGLMPAVQSLVMLVGIFIIMIQLDTNLTLIALVVCPPLYLAISAFNKHIGSAAERARDKESAVYVLLQRVMPAMRVVQAFTKEDEEHARFMAASHQQLNAALRLYTWQTAYSAVIQLLVAGGTAAVLWFGARAVMSGGLTIGEMLVFVSYLAVLYGPITGISETWSLLQAARVGVMRVFDILDQNIDPKDGTRALKREEMRGDIAWKGVHFDYSKESPVLRGIDLDVRAGEKIAIVGPTGAGKSTLLSLLPRFYDPSAGSIEIDGVDVREYRLQDLRRQIAMVLQPALVFPVTIRENIAYGRDRAEMGEIERAARLARIHETIEKLPQGYETVIGEAGATLSEGERQRLTIARAILRDARILILDEPTSSVDAETEALIMEGLHQLTDGRTTFIIAHRLSTVRRCDRIVVLRDGHIAEQGAFEELLKRDGPFAALYATQFAEQKPLKLVSSRD